MASSGLENIGLSLQGPGKEVRIEIDSPKIETPQEQSDFADLKIYGKYLLISFIFSFG